MIDVNAAKILQKEFIQTWPIDRLKKMTLEEYSDVGNKDTFCNWVESRTDWLGSIWGGSAFKFGIYHRKNKTTNKKWKKGFQTDGDFAWLKKYGTSRNEAFQNVKDNIIKIAGHSLDGKFNLIDNIDIGNSIKWKIASLYNPDNSILIFKREILFRIMDSYGISYDSNTPTSELYKNILKNKPSNSTTIEYSELLWKKYDDHSITWIIENFLIQAKTKELKTKGYPGEYEGLKLKISFGQGNQARVPWIAFLKDHETVQCGIYPVYLYYKSKNILILAYGVSETIPPNNDWDLPDETKTIEEYFLNKWGDKPDRYSKSLIYKIYDVDDIQSYDLQNELNDLLEHYNSQTLVAPNIDIKEEQKYWVMAPGDNAKYWQECLDQGIISYGADKVGNLSKISSAKEATELVKQAHNLKHTPINDGLACYQFAHEMKKGDYIFAKKGRFEIIGFGKITSDYRYDSSRTTYRNVRDVDWQKVGSWKSDLALKTLTDVTPYKDWLKKLLYIINSQDGKGITPSITDNDKSNYWWLNANPKIWNYSDIKDGETILYTTHNENGNKRRIAKYFQTLKPGDYLLGYTGTPIKEMNAILMVTQGVHDSKDGEAVEFKKIKDVKNPVSYSELKSISELNKCEPLINNQGSIFSLTTEEHDIIRDLIDEKNLSISDIKIEKYTQKEALKNLFISKDRFDDIINNIQYKKNIIIQGPPGVGKSFISKRIAYSVIGYKDDSKLGMVQFHQSYSYEDFIQGYRPTDDGNFEIKNGVFFEFCKKAQRDTNSNYVFIIDEINRGNLSKIFGELMLLIEHDKRGTDTSVSLTYANTLDEKFYIPENVFLIGTMNTADRSLAMVDYALRRRFNFINLKPEFSSKSFEEHLSKNGVSEKLIRKINERMNYLNGQISNDKKNLGVGYQIGHSFFCSNRNINIYDEDWYKNIIKNEIGPLIHEYWFDDYDKAEGAIKNLIQ